MNFIKKNVLYLIVFLAAVDVHCLVELREEYKDLAIAEAALRKTVNGLFSTLKLDHVKHKARFGEFAAIHNFFFTVTLKDDDNLKQIAILAKVDNIDNNTQHFIAQLNEVLNEDNKSYESGEDEYVTAHIETFIRKLEYLKFKYGFDNSTAKLGINSQVLNYSRSDETSQYNSKKALEGNDSNLLKSNELWTPGVSRRIFEGVRESITRFPFMASVQFYKKFQCSGSVLKPDLVITSASCLQIAWNNRFFRENPGFLSVQVGCELYEGCDENIPVLEVYFHPEYNPTILKNNLAIMRLVRKLKLGRKNKHVRMIDFDTDPRPLATNTLGITIIGWGAKSTSNIESNIWNNRLAYALLDFYPLKECQEVYSKKFVTEKNFCAGFFSRGGGACNRDAGGPGVVYGKLVGVVSFGAPNCGAPDAPTVFTKLGYYADWIEDIIDMKVPTVKKNTTDRTPRETWGENSFVISTKTELKIAPVTKPNLALRTVPDEDALRTSNDDNKLFKEFLKTMFGSEEVKEYLDQYDSDTDISQEKVSSKYISKSLTVKASTEPTTKANIEEHSSDLELPQDVLRGSVRMVTTIESFEDSEVKNDEKEETMPVNLKTDVEEHMDQNIAKLIDEIDIQELLESAIKTATKPKSSKRTKDKTKLKEMNSNKDKTKRKEIKLITDKIRPNIERKKDKIKPKGTQHIKDKVKPKKQISQEEEITVESASESIEESETSDDYTDGSSSEDYDIYHSDELLQRRRLKKASEVKFRQNGTFGSGHLFFHKNLLKLLHEVVAEVVGRATNKQPTNGILDRG